MRVFNAELRCDDFDDAFTQRLQHRHETYIDHTGVCPDRGVCDYILHYLSHYHGIYTIMYF